MALEVPMEAWFSFLQGGKTERLDTASEATGWQPDRTNPGVHPRGQG